ncbi:putative mycofactocin radical SAM maturase MftC [subsurface metagenome]
MKSGIKAIKTQEFWEGLYEKSAQEKIPLKASFELTYQCNLRCLHCYVPRRQKTQGQKTTEELSYSKVCSILDQLADLGCFHLNLTGGESLRRPDFFKILTYAKKKGFYTILLTNATLITPQVADNLADLNINQVDISLYGITPHTHEKITQIPGSFTRCLKGGYSCR